MTDNYPAGWRPAPVGGPVHEPEWFTDERLDKTYIQCSCGQPWPCQYTQGIHK